MHRWSMLHDAFYPMLLHSTKCLIVKRKMQDRQSGFCISIKKSSDRQSGFGILIKNRRIVSRHFRRKSEHENLANSAFISYISRNIRSRGQDVEKDHATA